MKHRFQTIESLERRTLLAAATLSIGSSTYDSASKSVPTADGGSIVAGIFSGTADFDPTAGKQTLTAAGDTDIFVARYSSTGALRWARQFGSDEGSFNTEKSVNFAIDPLRARDFDLGVGISPFDLGEYVTGLKVDSAGNAYLTGTFKGSVDFDPGAGQLILNSTGGRNYVDTFLLKLNAVGGLVYGKQIGGDFTDVSNALALDSANNVYITGDFTRAADFDPSSKSFVLSTNDNSREQIYVAKYDASGNFVWAKTTTTDEIDRTHRSAGNAIAIDSAGDVVVTGSFSGTSNFSPGTTTAIIEPAGETDAFVEKLSAGNGTLRWVKTFGGDDYAGGRAIATGADGSIYTGAYFERTIDVDPGAATVLVTATPERAGKKPTKSDLLFSKFDSDGNLLWARPIGNENWETLGNMAVDATGGLVISGSFYGALDFDPSHAKHVLTSTVGTERFKDFNDNDRRDSYDAFLLKLSSTGKYIYATRFGGAGDDFATDISLTSTGQALVAGQFRGTYIFPTNRSAKLRPIGEQDAFDALFDTGGNIV